MTEAIKTAAKALNACGRIDEASGLKGLAGLLFSPQGLEFCKKNNFPGMDMWRRIDAQEAAQYNVYIDQGEGDASGIHNVALIGNTHFNIQCTDTEGVHTILLQHGASATIDASYYAVVKVISIGEGNSVTIHNDGTAIII